MNSTQNLSHFSKHPTLHPYSVPQTGKRFGKPDGLWVSVDGPDDWPTWCREEDYGDIDAKHRFAIILASGSRILHLSQPEHLWAFTRTFDANPEGKWHGEIDWAAMAARYQGIIIAPYQWDCRLDSRTGWYYGWDCASGCIWDASAIASVKRVEAGTLA